MFPCRSVSIIGESVTGIAKPRKVPSETGSLGCACSGGFEDAASQELLALPAFRFDPERHGRRDTWRLVGDPAHVVAVRDPDPEVPLEALTQLCRRPRAPHEAR